MKKNLIVQIDVELHKAVKNLAKEYSTSIREITKRALVETLKKYGKKVPVKEL